MINFPRLRGWEAWRLGGWEVGKWRTKEVEKIEDQTHI